MLDKIVHIIEYLNKITFVFAFITMCLAIYAFWKSHKLNQSVAIILLRNGKYRHLVSIKRRMVTRDEILNLLAVFDISHQFNIAHTMSLDFFRDIEAVQLGKKNEIIIPIKDTDKLEIFSN